MAKIICPTCSRKFTGRRNQKYCDAKCRLKGFRAEANPLQENSPQLIQWGLLDSDVCLETDLILKSGLIIGPGGFACCPVCGGETHQEPVVLETEQSPIMQVVPVYHADCVSPLPSLPAHRH